MMVELLYKMTDSQAEQIETTGYPGKETITLPPDVARALSYVLDQTLGIHLRQSGVLLEGSQAFQFERDSDLRKNIEACKKSNTRIKRTIYLLEMSENPQIVKFKNRVSFGFSGKVFEQSVQPGKVVIEGEMLKNFIGALEDGIWQDLSVLAGNAETLSQTSKIKGVSDDFGRIHNLTTPLLEVPDQFRNLSRIIVNTDDAGNRKFELIPNQERVLIG